LIIALCCLSETDGAVDVVREWSCMTIKQLFCRGTIFPLLVVSLAVTSGCSGDTSANTVGGAAGERVIRIVIGTQDQTINYVLRSIRDSKA
jgi:hypothetical protein